MKRRSYLSAFTVAGITGFAGCSNLPVGDATKDDLNEYDTEGFESYKEGYEISQQAIDELEESGQLELFTAENPPERSPNWRGIFDTAEEYSEKFSEASELFSRSRDLAESPVFNDPSVTGEEWTSYYNDLAGRIRELSIHYYQINEGSMSDRWKQINPHPEVLDLVESRESVQEPIPTSELLQQVVDNYSII